MSAITRQQVKEWVVINASVTKPYQGQWSTSVTLAGYDYNDTGETIEQAYNKLTDHIFYSNYLLTAFKKIAQHE